VRSFAAVLPPKDVVSGCRFCCVGDAVVRRVPGPGGVGEALRYESRPVEVVDLALNASEDRVVGAWTWSGASEGSRKFEMGVLGKANGNVLYIDEVNLLDDHVVDVLLDVAVSGVNVVMREGVSYRHPSRFLLVGTMNPEEGSYGRSCWTGSGCAWRSRGTRRRVPEVDRRAVLLFEARRGVPGEVGPQGRGAAGGLMAARAALPRVEVPGRSSNRSSPWSRSWAWRAPRGHHGAQASKALAAIKGIRRPTRSASPTPSGWRCRTV